MYCFLGHYEPPQENNSDLREIDTPLENQDMRSRMTPDGGNPSEAKNNNDDDAKNSSPEKCWAQSGLKSEKVQFVSRAKSTC